MQAYVINLIRRPDRLRAARSQFTRHAIPHVRVPALDARRHAASRLARYFLPTGPLGTLSTGDMACTLSHLRALRTFLRSNDAYGVICEDDLLLSPEAGPWLTNDRWIPPGIQLIKLERFGPPNQHVVLSHRLETADRNLARLLSKHCGAAAYIVSRAAALEILDHCRRMMLLPIDHLLFNPNNSPLFARLSPWQLFPAVAQQHDVHGTDIHPLRLQQRPTGLHYFRRELIRAYYEVRQLPEQLGSLLRGEAVVQKVSFR